MKKILQLLAMKSVWKCVLPWEYLLLRPIPGSATDLL